MLYEYIQGVPPPVFILKVAPKYFFSKAFSEKMFQIKVGSKGDIKRYH